MRQGGTEPMHIRGLIMDTRRAATLILMPAPVCVSRTKNPGAGPGFGYAATRGGVVACAG